MISRLTRGRSRKKEAGEAEGLQKKKNRRHCASDDCALRHPRCVSPARAKHLKLGKYLSLSLSLLVRSSEFAFPTLRSTRRFSDLYRRAKFQEGREGGKTRLVDASDLFQANGRRIRSSLSAVGEFIAISLGFDISAGSCRVYPRFVPSRAILSELFPMSRRIGADKIKGLCLKQRRHWYKCTREVLVIRARDAILSPTMKTMIYPYR